MLGKIFFYKWPLGIALIVLQGFGYGQVLSCPELNTPSDGATDVSVSTDLEWSAISGATGYTIQIGTTSGGGEVLNSQDLGNVTLLSLEADLPPLSDIYISIFPSDTNGVNMTCSEFQFTTGMTQLPRCTEILNPRDGDVLVPVNNNITWIRDFTATGYRMSVVEGDPAGIRILDNVDVGNGTNFKPPNFEPRTTYFVTIVPYNDAGPAENCQAISFTTGDPLPLPDCAEVTFPLNGAANVPVDTNVEWNMVENVDGYSVTIGTTPNGFDIINNQDVGTDTSISLPNEFPMGAQIYIKVAAYKDGEMSASCELHSFETERPEIIQSDEFIPKFFTPNNDGINDEWRVNPPDNVSILQIMVYNRFGLLLKQLQPAQSWDGTFRGRLLPSGSYWYSVEIADAPQIRGYFALKR